MWFSLECGFARYDDVEWKSKNNILPMQRRVFLLNTSIIYLLLFFPFTLNAILPSRSHGPSASLRRNSVSAQVFVPIILPMKNFSTFAHHMVLPPIRLDRKECVLWNYTKCILTLTHAARHGRKLLSEIAASFLVRIDVLFCLHCLSFSMFIFFGFHVDIWLDQITLSRRFFFEIFFFVF